VDKYHSSIMGEGPQDNTQMTELVVTASSDQVDVLRQTKSELILRNFLNYTGRTN